MKDLNHQPKGSLILVAFAQDLQQIEQALALFANNYGKVLKRSPLFHFEETQYYEASMGKDLQLLICLFDQQINLSLLPDVKHFSNQIEEYLASQNSSSIQRPVNLDPGYITKNKFVLATTKDAAHRIYTNKGIYAEVTLHYADGTWQAHPWTYQNYKRKDYQLFFNEIRGLIS